MLLIVVKQLIKQLVPLHPPASASPAPPPCPAPPCHTVAFDVCVCVALCCVASRVDRSGEEPLGRCSHHARGKNVQYITQECWRGGEERRRRALKKWHLLSVEHVESKHAAVLQHNRDVLREHHRAALRGTLEGMQAGWEGAGWWACNKAAKRDALSRSNSSFFNHWDD